MYACTRARGDNHRGDGEMTARRKKRVDVNGEGSPERPSSRVLRIKKPETAGNSDDALARGLANFYLSFYMSFNIYYMKNI